MPVCIGRIMAVLLLAATACTSVPGHLAVPEPAGPAGLEGIDAFGVSGQAVLVTSESDDATTATLTAYERTRREWRPVLGPWTAFVGTNGIAPPGEKMEGDGRTPAGIFRFDFFFGVSPDPGVRFPYRPVTPDIVWDDDPTSPLYNRWVDRTEQDPGAEPEEMYQPVAYAYGAVIDYNRGQVPGVGSAIFLHASTGRPTAGCVSLPADQLVHVLRWLDPTQSPQIVIRVA